MSRKVIKDFTLSDGTVIPLGDTIVAAAYATHHDKVIISKPLS
jgi:cytochrome P450